MASTEQSSGRIDPLLTAALAGYRQTRDKFIADKLPINVQVTPAAFSGKIKSYPLALGFGDAGLTTGDGLKRNSGSRYARPFNSHRPTLDSYECIERSAAVDIEQQDLERATDGSLDAQSAQDQLERKRTIPLWATMLIEKEQAVATATFDTSVFTQTSTAALLAGGAGFAWNAAGSSPTQDGTIMREIIRTSSAEYPDWGVMTHDVVAKLRYHTETLKILGLKAQGVTYSPEDLIKVDADVLALYAERWQLSKGLFAFHALRNSAKPGQTAALAEMASGKVMFGCSHGIDEAAQLGTAIELGLGPVSLMIVTESGPRVLRDETHDPHGVQVTVKHSYTTATPTGHGATTAYVLTSVNG